MKERIAQLLEAQKAAVVAAEQRYQQLLQNVEVASADINHQRGRRAMLEDLLKELSEAES